MNAHRRKEAKAARRRARVKSGRRPRRVDMTELAGEGAAKLTAASATLPPQFGLAKRRIAKVEEDAVVEMAEKLVAQAVEERPRPTAPPEPAKQRRAFRAPWTRLRKRAA